MCVICSLTLGCWTEEKIKKNGPEPNEHEAYLLLSFFPFPSGSFQWARESVCLYMCVCVRLLSSQEQLILYSLCVRVCACSMNMNSEHTKHTYMYRTTNRNNNNNRKKLTKILYNHLNMSIISLLLLLPGIFLDACMLYSGRFSFCLSLSHLYSCNRL